MILLKGTVIVMLVGRVLSDVSVCAGSPPSLIRTDSCEKKYEDNPNNPYKKCTQEQSCLERQVFNLKKYDLKYVCIKPNIVVHDKQVCISRNLENAEGGGDEDYRNKYKKNGFEKKEYREYKRLKAQKEEKAKEERNKVAKLKRQDDIRKVVSPLLVNPIKLQPQDNKVADRKKDDYKINANLFNHQPINNRRRNRRGNLI